MLPVHQTSQIIRETNTRTH